MNLSTEAEISLALLIFLLILLGMFFSSKRIYQDRWSWSLFRRHLLIWGTPTAAAIVLIAFLGD